MRRIVSIMGLALLLTGPAGAQKEDISKVIGTGSVEIGNGTRADASQGAFDQAMQDALMQVIRERVPEKTLTPAQPQVQEKILSHAKDYVRNYQTLEEKIAGGTVTVRVSADVWIDSVKRDLATLGLAQDVAVVQERRVRLIVPQPDRYHKIVLLRKYLQEESPSVGRVATAELSKKSVALDVTLKKNGSLEQLSRDLAAQSFDGRSPKVTRVADDRLEVVL